MCLLVELINPFLVQYYCKEGKKMLYPSIDKLLNIVDSKYILVHVASIRSKQMLENGHFQMKETEYKNKKSLGRALEEVENGLITIFNDGEKTEKNA